MGSWAIAVHGGVDVDPNLPQERQEEAKQLLTRCLNLGISALGSSLPAINVVGLVVRELESDPLFNSGRGSALTEKGTVEMEASIMDGPKRRCGVVSSLTTVKNPVSFARLVMDKSPHSYLAFSDAEAFARQQGVELVPNFNNNKALKEAMCFMMDPAYGKKTCYVQFPQRFDGIDLHDGYANRNIVFFDINLKGLDGIQGPVYVGTGCCFNRQALYGYDPVLTEEDLEPNIIVKSCCGSRKKSRSGNKKDIDKKRQPKEQNPPFPFLTWRTLKRLLKDTMKRSRFLCLRRA